MYTSRMSAHVDRVVGDFSFALNKNKGNSVSSIAESDSDYEESETGQSQITPKVISSNAAST
jgi:hypothetical protein